MGQLTPEARSKVSHLHISLCQPRTDWHKRADTSELTGLRHRKASRSAINNDRAGTTVRPHPDSLDASLSGPAVSDIPLPRQAWTVAGRNSGAGSQITGRQVSRTWEFHKSPLHPRPPTPAFQPAHIQPSTTGKRVEGDAAEGGVERAGPTNQTVSGMSPTSRGFNPGRGFAYFRYQREALALPHDSKRERSRLSGCCLSRAYTATGTPTVRC
ncbi:hypothetical protein JZ751_024935 [Albula glossodonta]|uniref:Uncharacterized protein n=1 Tax=Albula glossodonta TaxID=121402 RepID=A0A8T2PEU5_9TELE|nr:hypothetical protein JZ751_024935 [Albula glossodonta]